VTRRATYAKVRNPEIAISLAIAHGARRELKEMVPYLQDAARRATSIEMLQWANEMLKEVQGAIAEHEKARAEYEAAEKMRKTLRRQ
jgi:hypothetical protein